MAEIMVCRYAVGINWRDSTESTRLAVSFNGKFSQRFPARTSTPGYLLNRSLLAAAIAGELSISRKSLVSLNLSTNGSTAIPVLHPASTIRVSGCTKRVPSS